MTGGAMADFAMDYETLYALKKGMHDLADDAASGGDAEKFKEVGERSSSENTDLFGSSYLASQFATFYRYSKMRAEDGADRLREFGNTFEGVADVMYEQDAQIASSATASALAMQLNRWKSDRAAFEEWEADQAAWDAYLEEIGAADYFAEHPDADINEVCQEDGAPDWCETYMNDEDSPAPPGPKPPEPPENPPSHMEFKDENGNEVDVVIGYDEDFNIMKETSTVTLEDGTEYSTETVYDGPPEWVDPPDTDPENPTPAYDTRDYTVTSTSPDGTVTVEKFTIAEDGSGTNDITTTTTDEDGNETVETSQKTRSGPGADWVGDEDEE
ncbi:serine/arginine repetitive matrix protein 2 [Streptomyces sp. MS19]|uniref:serine/arginine repetitive matrix protein 2 n=1 Tax=Streptomyces sp. MS19 TaxID=3385972 RepID=UPI0039A2F0A5